MANSGLRSDLALISGWIAPGSRVLDLGCGDGALLAHLRAHRDVKGYGLEIDGGHVVQCIVHGINVIQSDLDAGLADFDSQFFDYVIMTQTLQAVHFPQRILSEMLRVGREGIVTFPNFGHWKPRVYLGLGGRMPMSRALPNEWYDTPNIHLCTLKDFEDLCNEKGIDVRERTVVDASHRQGTAMRWWPNLLGEIAIYRLRRRGV